MGNKQQPPEEQARLSRNSAELARELDKMGVHAKEIEIEALK